MFTEVLSSIGNPLIVTGMVWVSLIIMGQVAKMGFLNGAKVVVDNVENDKARLKAEKTYESAKKKINAGFKIFNIALTTVTIVFVVIFVVFLSNWGAKSEYQTDKIEQAPLPENFTATTEEAIVVSNEEAVTIKSTKNEKEATEANNNAMTEAAKLFK